MCQFKFQLEVKNMFLDHLGGETTYNNLKKTFGNEQDYFIA